MRKLCFLMSLVCFLIGTMVLTGCSNRTEKEKVPASNPTVEVNNIFEGSPSEFEEDSLTENSVVSSEVSVTPDAILNNTPVPTPAPTPTLTPVPTVLPSATQSPAPEFDTTPDVSEGGVGEWE